MNNENLGHGVIGNTEVFEASIHGSNPCAPVKTCLFCHKLSESRYCSRACAISYRNGEQSRQFEIFKNQILLDFNKEYCKSDVKNYCKNHKIPYRRTINFLKENGRQQCKRIVSLITREKLRLAAKARINVNKQINKFKQNDIDRIRKLYESGYSSKDLLKIEDKSLVRFTLKGRKRTRQESVILAHKRYPESFKLSDKTKNKIRKARVEYLKKQTGKTAFERRFNGQMSYGEQKLHDLFVKNHIYEKYDVINEYCEFPYFLDFAFINEKVDVEFDGKWHFTERRQLHDKKRDNYLQQKDWRIYRIAYHEIDTFDIQKLLDFIGDAKEKTHSYNLNSYFKIKQQKKEQKLKRRHESLKHLIDLRRQKINQRREIIKKINPTCYGWMSEASELLNISHTSVRRFIERHCKDLEIYRRQPSV